MAFPAGVGLELKASVKNCQSCDFSKMNLPRPTENDGSVQSAVGMAVLYCLVVVLLKIGSSSFALKYIPTQKSWIFKGLKFKGKIIKMSESQTKAGNQRKFENLKIFENLK